ncbi:ATP-binding cassette domain-containing protein [Alcaligenaceae bacterium CGII-47]|nr:ATP-binding cassette domain-containing protein [Alcaligenaceae bacterium CGII-47]
MAELLRLEGVWAGYGDSTVLEDISLSLEEGGSLALLGRNGMGKTTLLATLMGVTRMRRGHIFYRGEDIIHVSSHKRARAGFGWVPQERDVFRSLTVEENLTVVAQPGEWTLRRVYETFPRLEERQHNLGSQLSGGEQQMLAMSRALMLNPKLLLLDEPLEGLAPLIAQELLHIIDQMVSQGSMAVILVEQHAKQILPITQQAIILERGRIVHQGPSAELARDQQTMDRWLGVVSVQPEMPEADVSVPSIQSDLGTDAIAIIRNEHRALAAILHCLSSVIDDIEAGRLEADLKLLAAMVEYISEVTDKVHHPKENQLFALLRRHTSEVDAMLDELELEHRDGPILTASMDRALVHFMQAGDEGFAVFRDAARAYIADEWVHMGKEEDHVLPAARKYLSAQDWAVINLEFSRNGDPWSGPNNQYAELFKRIATLAPAPIGFGRPARTEEDKT